MHVKSNREDDYKMSVCEMSANNHDPIESNIAPPI